jgi:nicotinamide mononucleotide transporter
MSRIQSLELLALMLSLLMVWGNFKQWAGAWVFAMLSSAIYAWIFAASKLYAEAVLQGVFMVCAVWGWWQWRAKGANATIVVRRLSHRAWLLLLASLLPLWLGVAEVLQRYTDSDSAYADALPSAASLLAQFLLAKKFLENWLWWLAINLFSVGLFAHKGLWLTALLYAAFVPLSWLGWRAWLRLRAPSLDA